MDLSGMSPFSLHLTFRLPPRSEYHGRIESPLLIFIVTYAIS